MKKKIKKEKVETPVKFPVEIIGVPPVVAPKENVIKPLELDLGRHDLNTLVAKLNEIISYLNK